MLSSILHKQINYHDFHNIHPEYSINPITFNT